MGIYAVLPTKGDIEEVADIFDELRKDATMDRVIRDGLRSYEKTVTSKLMNVDAFFNLMKNPRKAPLDRQILWYDYVKDRLFRDIIAGRAPNGYSLSTREKIESYIQRDETKNLNAPHSLQSSWGLHNINNFSSPVPNFFFKAFFGYRRSANLGDVVRFYLKLDRTNVPQEAKYYNFYMRGGIGWRVSGVGRYIDNILYLIGHTTTLDRKQSLGLRMMALCRHELTDNLCGVVISLEQNAPIAARIFLVPVELHPFLGEGMRKKLLSEHPDQILDEEIRKVTKIENLMLELSNKSGITEEKQFAALIENFTPTVIRAGNLQPFNIDALASQMHRLRTYTLATAKDESPVWRLGLNLSEAVDSYMKDKSEQTEEFSDYSDEI